MEVKIPMAFLACSFSTGGECSVLSFMCLVTHTHEHTHTRGISVRFACCSRLTPSLLTLFVQSLNGPVIQELTGSVEGVESQSMDGGRRGAGSLETGWWQPQPGGLSLQMHSLTLKFIHVCSWTFSYQNHFIQVVEPLGIISWETEYRMRGSLDLSVRITNVMIYCK